MMVLGKENRKLLQPPMKQDGAFALKQQQMIDVLLSYVASASMHFLLLLLSLQHPIERTRRQICDWFLFGWILLHFLISLQGQDCFICKKGGHRAKDCPEKHRSGSQNSKICLKCGDSRHDMFSCRNDYSPEDLKVHRHFLMYFVSFFENPISFIYRLSLVFGFEFGVLIF